MQWSDPIVWLVLVPTLFLLVTTAIALAIPMRRLSLRVAWLAMLFVICMLDPEGSGRWPSGIFGTALLVAMTVLISVTAATVIKLLWRVIRRWSIAPTSDADVDASSASLDIPLIATGVLAGVTMVYAVGMLGARIQPAWMAPTLILGVSVGMLALWPLVRWLGTTASVRQFAASLGCSAVVVGVGVVLWISHSINSVVEGAEAAAGGKPYCIQVQGGSAIYKAAGRKLDFSPQTMRAFCSQGLCLDHHAVLVIADGASSSPSHWSYTRKNFMPGVLNSAVSVVCQPSPHFARGLQLF